MKNKKPEQSEKNIVAVEEALSKSEQFIEKNQNILLGVVAVIVLIIVGYIGFNRYIIEPREQEAKAEMFMAERYFEQDSLQLAINGDGTHLGFIDIISDYRMTKSANLAKYYTGVAYLNLGEYDNAIEYLSKFRRKDQILGAMALGAMGDAYLAMGDQDKAINHYKKAVSYKPNRLTTPAFSMKLGMVYELAGEYQKAIEVYEDVKKEFPDTNEGRNIEKYIARASQKASS